MKHYHLQSQGQQRGPFPESEVRSMLAAGTLAPKDLCWTQGMSDWRPVEEVIPRPSEVQPPPSPPPRSVAPSAAREKDPIAGAAASGNLSAGHAGSQVAHDSGTPKRGGSIAVRDETGADETTRSGVRSLEPAALLQIARAQKGIIRWCCLVPFVVAFAILPILGLTVALVPGAEVLNPVGSAALIGVIVAAAVNLVYHTYRLARGLKYAFPILWSVGISVGIFVPLTYISLVLLYVLSRNATRCLRGAGIRVGLMGARIEDIDLSADAGTRASVQYRAGPDD